MATGAVNARNRSKILRQAQEGNRIYDHYVLGVKKTHPWYLAVQSHGQQNPGTDLCTVKGRREVPSARSIHLKQPGVNMSALAGGRRA